MTATGMGLIEEDRTHEIVAGTELTNIWEKTCKHCPWYKHLHDLLGSSPVVERATISHNLTQIDTTCLMRSQGQMVGKVTKVEVGVGDPCSDDIDDNYEPGDFEELFPREEDSHQGSPGLDNAPGTPRSWDPTPPPESAPAHENVSASPPTSSRNPQGLVVNQVALDTSAPVPPTNKRKMAIDITTADREARVGLAECLAESNAKSWLECEWIKACHNFAVEKMWIQAEMDKVKATQAHELEMLKLRLGVGTINSNPLTLPGLPDIPSFSQAPSRFAHSHSSSPYDPTADLLEGPGSAEPSLLADFLSQQGFFQFLPPEPGLQEGNVTGHFMVPLSLILQHDIHWHLFHLTTNVFCLYKCNTPLVELISIYIHTCLNLDSKVVERDTASNPQACEVHIFGLVDLQP
ncbi:hypothetical protein K439DRAFT_1619725 [Ramaria rubella]|nr:hypothetical protein K439DRAFT_1619725 [Ramaria rubella]